MAAPQDALIPLRHDERYPYVYGPGQLIPREWSVIRRILDGRRTFVLPEGGLTLMSHGYGKHIAHAVLLATDHIDVATGKAYNCGDQITLSLRQWVQTTAAACGVEAEVVSIPDVAGELDTLTGALIDGLRRNSPSAVASPSNYCGAPARCPR